MKIFLTGSSGFIGKNLINLLLKKDHSIFATTRKKQKIKNKKLKWLYGDFNENWQKELKQSDLLIHLAASGVNKKNIKNDIYEVNVFKSLNFLQNAVKAGCKKWLIISSSSEYGKNLKNKNNEFSTRSNRIPDSDYGISKAIFSDQCINLAKKKKCQVRLMRIFPAFGKGENINRLYPSLIQAIKKKRNFTIKEPNEKRDFTNIKFICDTILDATNFKKRKFKFSQIWHISENKPNFVREFANYYWKKYQAKGKLITLKSRVNFTHISNNSSIWKI